MNKLIKEIFSKQKVIDKNGKEYPLVGNIDLNEGQYLYNLIKKNADITQTLEIGCAYGVASLFICSALENRKNKKHIIIDPFQDTDYNGIGLFNLDRSGINFYKYFNKKSEFILPELAVSHPNSFDLIFIDGWHTFDHTMIDLFYANKLIKKNGYIVIDDCRYHSVSKAVSYFSSYPSYSIISEVSTKKLSYKAKLTKTISYLIPKFLWMILPKFIYDILSRVQYSSMVTLKKIDDDHRDWKWFKNF
tara:strand:+ start:177 stop:917 length:741 start_codon:yes stop_codon:yes gene_type:complete